MPLYEVAVVEGVLQDKIPEPLVVSTWLAEPLTEGKVFDPATSVGTVTVPVKVGEAIGAAPKLVSAPVAVVAPVPPFKIGTIPVTLSALSAAKA